MHVILRKIGNSSAVIIPKSFLKHLGTKAGDQLDLSLKKDHLILSLAKPHRRVGWAEVAKQIARPGADTFIWPEFANNDDEVLNMVSKQRSSSSEKNSAEKNKELS
jgi:antitoxin MazE